MVALFVSFGWIPDINIQQQVGMVSNAPENLLVDDVHAGAVYVFDVFTLHSVEIEVRARRRVERGFSRDILRIHLSHGVILREIVSRHGSAHRHLRDDDSCSHANTSVSPKANVRDEIHAKRTIPHFRIKHRLAHDHGDKIHTRRQLENKRCHPVYEQIPLAVLFRLLHSHGL